MILPWRKSSHSNGCSNCVQIRPTVGGYIQVSNSRDLSQGVLTFTPDEWTAFLHGAKGGEFDLDPDREIKAAFLESLHPNWFKGDNETT